MGDHHQHGAVAANCTETCEASGHGTCFQEEGSSLFSCVCDSGWTRDDMLIVNSQPSCPVPLAVPLTISSALLIGSCYVAIWAIRMAISNPSTRRFSLQILVSALIHASYDATRLFTFAPSAWSTLGFASVTMMSLHMTRVIICELASEAYHLLERDPQRLKPLILVRSRIMAWTNSAVDSTLFLVSISRLYCVAAIQIEDWDAFNYNTVSSACIACIAYAVVLGTLQVFFAQMKVIVSFKSSVPNSKNEDFLLDSLEEFRNTILFVAIFLFMTSAFLYTVYILKSQESDYTWIVFQMAQIGTFGDVWMLRSFAVRLATFKETRPLKRAASVPSKVKQSPNNALKKSDTTTSVLPH